MGKGSQRRLALISRGENDLRWALALGKITYAEWAAGMADLEAQKNPRGVCGQCIDGLMVGEITFQPNYKITCRIDSTIHHQWDTCAKFREDK